MLCRPARLNLNTSDNLRWFEAVHPRTRRSSTPLDRRMATSSSWGAMETRDDTGKEPKLLLWQEADDARLDGTRGFFGATVASASGGGSELV